MHHLSSSASCYGRLVPGAQASGGARPMDSINSRTPGSFSVSRGSTHGLASTSGRELARRRGRSRTQVRESTTLPPVSTVNLYIAALGQHSNNVYVFVLVCTAIRLMLPCSSPLPSSQPSCQCSTCPDLLSVAHTASAAAATAAPCPCHVVGVTP